jgi:folate-binding protein YgfZ
MSDPLHELHRQAEAEFQDWGPIQIVSTFGEPQAEYAAIRKSVGMLDLPQRGVVQLTGRDRLAFLNNLISAQVWDKQSHQPLAAGRWVYAFLLNLRGRIVADLNVLELEDRTILEVDRSLATPLVGLLEAYRFAEQVKIENRCEELGQIALHGPEVAELLSSVTSGPCGPGDVGGVWRGRLFETETVGWWDNPAGTPGMQLIAPSDALRKIWMGLLTRFGGETRRLRPVGWAAFNATRIEAGRPVFGIDIEPAPITTALPSKQQRAQVDPAEAAPGMLPAETSQFERAVSLTKCYLGQEIVARMHARGQVARKIVGVKMEDDALPIAAAPIYDSQSNQVGVVTSSTNSPVLSNVAICLGIVKRPAFEVGNQLRIPAEGQLRAGTIVQTPFVRLG